MGFIPAILLFQGLSILTSFFSIFCFKYFYLIMDTVIVGIFLITGTIDSWGSRWEISSWFMTYLLFKSLFLFLLFLWKKLMDTTIVFGDRSTLQKILIFFNMILNFISVYPAAMKTLGSIV